MLRDVHPDDAFSISEIYNHYVQHTPITFEETPIAPDDMRSRILERLRPHCPGSSVKKTASSSATPTPRKWRERSAYRHSVETTVYLHPTAVGKGKGSELLGIIAHRFARPRNPLRHGWRRAAESGQHRPAREIPTPPGRPLPRGRLQIWPVDRRWLLAARVLKVAFAD